MPRKLTFPTFIALAFAMLSWGWVLSTDLLLRRLGLSPAATAMLSLLKGAVYIVCSSLIIYFVLRKAERSAAKARAAEIDRAETSEELLRSVFEHAPVAVAVFDLEMRYVTASKRWLVYHRVHGQNLTGRSLYEVAPETSDDWKRAYQRVLLGETITQTEEFVQKDGQLRWLVWQSWPWRRQTGEIGGIVVGFEDLSAQWSAQQAVANANERLRLHMQQTPMAVIEWDTEGRIREWNPAAERTFGYSKKEAVGKDWRLIVPDGLQEQFNRIWTHLLSGSGDSRSTNQNRTKDGRVITCDWLNTRLLDATGNMIGVASFASDVSERVVAEEKLRLSEERLREAAKTARFGYFAADIKNNTLYWSPEMREILGLPADAKMPEADSVPDFIHPEDRELFAAPLRTAQEPDSDGWVNVEHRIVWPDGSIRWVELRNQVYFETEGTTRKAVRCHGILLDITDRKLAEQEQALLYQKYIQSQKMEAIGRLAAGVAHDINNVFHGILLFSELLLTKEDRPRVQEKLRQIAASTQRGASIVKQLLAFSRQQVAQPKAVDVNESLEDVLKMLERVVREDIQISLELDKAPCYVLIDPGQFLQVVMNLVVNAQDAMPAGGAIRIRTRHAVRCPESGTEACVEISVQDTGCGIAPEHRDHIFEPFFTTKEVGKGTGLGLATTYGIVKQALGQVDFESEIGRGTTFRVLLPETAVQSEAQSQAVRDYPPSTVAKMVLVEDNAAVRIGLCDALSSRGIDVHAFDCPLSAATFVEQNSFDLLVTDLVMPGGRGDEFAQRVRERNPDLPVIFMSGYPDQILGAEQLPSKTVLLQKPFSVSKLLEQVLALTKDSAV